jgi:starvation-inducible DNA-binding protein
MIKTKNDLSAKIQTEMIQLLNARLSDAIDLELQTKQAHWNVKGPSFIGLHELFDKLAEEVEEHIDTIAERAVQLGGVAHGTIQETQRKTTLPEYPTDIFEGAAHVRRFRILTRLSPRWSGKQSISLTRQATKILPTCLPGCHD